MIRGLIALLASCCSLYAQAFTWHDLWATPDQQAQQMMNKGQFAKAKETFTREDWKAAASYRSGDYEQAADLYEGLNSQQGHYNRGNALAHMGQYEQAIESYKKALAINPKDEDAKYNLKLLEELMKKDKDKQQNKNQKGQQNKDQQNKDQQNKDQQNKDQQNKDQQNKDQQKKDQQNKDQQNKDQQNKDQQNKNKQSKSKSQKQDEENKGKKKEETAVQTLAQQEKKQAQEQWLRLIPDDPGGLMREKFLRDHLRRERGWYQ